jgi:hypothetical protein
MSSETNDSDFGPSKRKRNQGTSNDKYKRAREQVAELQDQLQKANTQIELLKQELRNKDNALSTVINHALPQPFRQPAEVPATFDPRPEQPARQLAEASAAGAFRQASPVLRVQVLAADVAQPARNRIPTAQRLGFDNGPAARARDLRPDIYDRHRPAPSQGRP